MRILEEKGSSFIEFEEPFIFLRKKGHFSDVFSALYSQRSVTAAWANIFPHIYLIWNRFLLSIFIQNKYFLKVIQKFLIWKHFSLTILLQIQYLIQIMQTVWPSLHWGCTWIIKLVFGSGASWEPYKALCLFVFHKFCHKFGTLWLKYI